MYLCELHVDAEVRVARMGIAMRRLKSGALARREADTQDFGILAFRFLVAIDIEGFSRRYVAEQATIQNDLENAMTKAAAGAGLDRGRWYRQPRGDGELAVLPQSDNGLSLVADYPRKLASAVAEVNLAGNTGSRLRVYLAIHHGAVTPGRFGPVGAAPVVISWLVDAEPARQQLRERSDLDIALIVSETVYEEIIQSRLHDLNPQAFRRTVIKTKGVSYVGYLYQGVFETRDGKVVAPQAQPATI